MLRQEVKQGRGCCGPSLTSAKLRKKTPGGVAGEAEIDVYVKKPDVM